MNAKKWTARGVATAEPAKHLIGDGLYLIVTPSLNRRWVSRFSHRGKVSETGLCSLDHVSLEKARHKAMEARLLARSGVSPVAA